MSANQPDHLRLERRKANLLFSSWRLSSAILRSEGSVPLPSPAAPAQASDTDYITARHAALLNGITQQPHGCYAFLDEQAQPGQLGLYQIELGEVNKAPQLHKVCGMPQVQQDLPPGGLVAGSLPPSVVEVQSAAAGGDTAGSGTISSIWAGLLLISSGQGDVSLVHRPAASHPAQPAAVMGAPVFPLRPALPLQGARPLHLAAAYQLPGSTGSTSSSGSQAAGGTGSGAAATIDICSVLWAARPRSERQPSRCEVYAVRLTAQLDATPALQVQDVQLLKVSDLPPHGVLANPATGGVLLALQPSSASVEEEAAAQRAAVAAAPEARSGAAAMQEDAEEDDISPRTLAAAVARLAAYTSEEPVGPLPHQQYADLYHESGPDGVGAMGAEPTCTLFTFALAASPAAAESQAGAAEGVSSSSQAAAAARGQAGQLLQLVGTLSCQPHKLLTCHLEQPASGAQEPPTPDTHLPPGSDAPQGQQQQQVAGGSSSGGRLLLGLTDDVDCAVVAVSCSSSAGSGSIEGGRNAGEVDAGFVIEHVSSIPAMAYVAAGKVQRKFLLLAPPGGDISAALVEASKYCYLYRSTAPRQEYGEHQVVDMELPDSSGRGVLGAVLAGSRAGACRLVLLAREGLWVMDM